MYPRSQNTQATELLKCCAMTALSMLMLTAHTHCYCYCKAQPTVEWLVQWCWGPGQRPLLTAVTNTHCLGSCRCTSSCPWGSVASAGVTGLLAPRTLHHMTIDICAVYIDDCLCGCLLGTKPSKANNNSNRHHIETEQLRALLVFKRKTKTKTAELLLSLNWQCSTKFGLHFDSTEFQVWGCSTPVLT